MNAEEYTAAMLRTANGVHREYEVAVVGLGLSGESSELDEKLAQRCYPLFGDAGFSEAKAFVADEGGDVYWYIARLCSLYDIGLHEVLMPFGPACDIKEECRTLMRSAGNVADYLKKVIGHRHPMDTEKLIILVAILSSSLNRVLASYHLELSEVWENNYQKLMKRYPNGFDPERSQRRRELE